MDGFAGAKLDGFAGHPHLLPLVAGEVHFDAVALAIVEGVMLKAAEVEFSVELAVDPHEDVEIEGAGYPGSIVVSGVNDPIVFLQIGAHNQSGSAAKNDRDVA